MTDDLRTLFIFDRVETGIGTTDQSLGLPFDLDLETRFSEAEKALDSDYAKVIYVSSGLVIDPALSQCELLLVHDHICLWDTLEFTPKHEGQVRFLDISEPYDMELLVETESRFQSLDVVTARTIIFSHPAPELTTPTERGLMRASGAGVIHDFLPLLAKLVRSKGIALSALLFTEVTMDRDRLLRLLTTASR